ncbi:MAG: PTS sugar transporter subunit IIA [Gammaproteobacteria bacterium]
MNVGLLLITHGGIGQSLYDAVVSMLGSCPLNTEVLAVAQDQDPEVLLQQAQALCKSLDHGGGVLVFTDMYGSTPSNVACALQHDKSVAIVTGVNLPMLVRVLNYPELQLEQLVKKALSAGREGVMSCQKKP